MEPEWAPAREPSERRIWDAAVPPVVETLRGRSHEISVGMLKRIGEAVPDLVANPDDAEINRASNEANLLLVADLLERGADPAGHELPVPTLAFAQEGVRQNTPLAGLMRAYRIGHAYAWELMLATLRDRIPDPDEFADAVRLISAWLHAFVDAAVCTAEDVYLRERERWVRSTSALRAAAIERLLEGRGADTVELSLRLGYELDRNHIALVAWLDELDAAVDPVAAVEAALGEAAGRAGAQRPLIHSLGLLTGAAWVGSRDVLDPASLIAPLDAEVPVHLAVGEPGHGVDGFRRSHLQAMQARRVMTLANRPGGEVARYSDVALVALATADLTHARAFVREQLGPLVLDGDTNLRLLATARAYLDQGGSHARAANQLGIHENTVRYRVRQVEDLLERPIVPADLDLHVALALAETAPALSPEER